MKLMVLLFIYLGKLFFHKHHNSRQNLLKHTHLLYGAEDIYRIPDCLKELLRIYIFCAYILAL